MESEVRAVDCFPALVRFFARFGRTNIAAGESNAALGVAPPTVKE
jgi:hypothetical protein